MPPHFILWAFTVVKYLQEFLSRDVLFGLTLILRDICILLVTTTFIIHIRKLTFTNFLWLRI